jgi:hypothetical protein
MLAIKGKTWAGRGVTAVCLILLFCLSPLALMAARSFDTTAASMRCCRTKAACPSHKHSATNSTSVTFASACCTDCGSGHFGNTSIYGDSLGGPQIAALTVRPFGAVVARTGLLQSVLTEHNLRQRPPPHSQA